MKGEELLDFLTATLNKKGYGFNKVKYEPRLQKLVWHGSFEESCFELCYNRLLLHGAKFKIAKDEWDTTICIIRSLSAFEKAVEQLEYINEPVDTHHVKSVHETYLFLQRDYREFMTWLEEEAEIKDEVDLIDCVAKVQPVNLTKVYENGILKGYIEEEE